jgi:hypothetical protein
MSISKSLFDITRRCTVCGKQKSMLGSTTYPKFICKDCKEAQKKDGD